MTRFYKLIFNSYLLICLSFLMNNNFTHAQDRMRSEERIKMLKENLSLTDEQVEKIKVIFSKNEIPSQDLSPSERRQIMLERREKIDKEIETILTKEQLEKYNKLKEERRKEMQNRFRNRNSN